MREVGGGGGLEQWDAGDGKESNRDKGRRIPLGTWNLVRIGAWNWGLGEEDGSKRYQIRGGSCGPR